jgi:hypothetical protein
VESNEGDALAGTRARSRRRARRTVRRIGDARSGAPVEPLVAVLCEWGVRDQS